MKITAAVFYSILSLTALLAPSVHAQADPASPQFAVEEQRLLAGLLSDPAQSQSYKTDGAAVVDQKSQREFFVVWRAKLADFAKNYLSRQPVTNLNGKTVPEMIERMEFKYFMAYLNTLEDTVKNRIIKGEASRRILAANQALIEHDNSKALELIDMARSILRSEFKAYADSEVAANAVAQAAQIITARKEEAARTALEKAKELERAAERAKKNPSDDQASHDGGKGYDGGKGGSGKTEPAPVQPPANGGKTPLPDLTGPTKPVDKQPIFIPPPIVDTPEDATADLEKMKNAGGSSLKKMFALAVAGGAVLGGVGGFFAGGPLGAAVGAAAGATVGYFIMKKLTSQAA